jgi:tRNA(Ile)-lysidine synthase
MPTAEQIERFRRDIEALAGGTPERLGVAVSGGPDSLALLLLASAAFPGRVDAGTVDHRLRPENAGEAALVARICRDLGVPHETLADPAAPIAGASAQAQARALRYRLLAGWARGRGIALLATAHHADDQAETVLMRLARGAGLGGLSGIRSRREEEEVALLRPLLGWRRAELAAVVVEAGLTAVDDPSNRSDAYDRTRFRALLAGSDLLPALRLAAAAAHLSEAEQALAWAAEREWQARASDDEGAILLDATGLPAELLRRVSERAIETVRGDRGDWRRDKLAGILEEVAAGGRATLAGVQVTGGPVWRFEPEPPRRLARDPRPPL